MFRNDKSIKAFEKLNCKHKIWAERSVVLDEVEPAIRANLESRGWLSQLEIDHPSPDCPDWKFLLESLLLGVGYEVLSSPLLFG